MSSKFRLFASKAHVCTHRETKRKREKGRERRKFLFIFRLSLYCLHTELFTRQQFYFLHIIQFGSCARSACIEHMHSWKLAAFEQLVSHGRSYLSICPLNKYLHWLMHIQSNRKHTFICIFIWRVNMDGRRTKAKVK